MSRLLQDLRYALRQLKLAPGFALVALVSLALGIGTNTAIFQLLEAVRLRNLPIHDPQQLAEIRVVGGNKGFGISNGFYAQLTRPIWREIKDHHEPFSGVFAWDEQEDRMAAGALLSLLASRSVASLLFGLKPHDPLTLVASSLLLGGIAVLASFVPARRAAKVDPMVALRYE